MNLSEMQPPRWASKLLKLLCTNEMYEEIAGDLTQEFYRDLRRFGLKRANREFTWNVVRYARPGILIRNKFSLPLDTVYLLRNYLLVAIRSHSRQRLLTLINVVGLAIGLGCFCLLSIYTKDELSFDRFHQNGKNIYRLHTEWKNIEDGQVPISYTDESGPTAISLGEALKNNFTEIIDFARIQLAWGENLVRTNTTILRASISFSDASFFKLFSFRVLQGSKEKIMSQPNDLVITRKRAIELFGTEDVVGRELEIQLGNKYRVFKITGVIEDTPSNSTIRLDIIVNYDYVKDVGSPFIVNSWHPTVRQTYVWLKEGSSLWNDSKRLNKFLLRFNPGLADLKGDGFKWNDDNPPVKLKLQPLYDIHTDTKFHGWAFTDFGVIDKKIIWVLSAISLAILFVAIINFATLSIAQLSKRSKEVGVRKVTGAKRGNIAFQFLLESILLTLMAGVLGLLLVVAALPWFNQISGRALNVSQIVSVMPLCIGIVLVTGIVAGAYPSLILSNFKAVNVLKNKLKVGGANAFTGTLVTVQFTVSIALMISTIVIVRQADYMINRDIGFQKNNVLVIDATETDVAQLFPRLKQELLTIPGVSGVACSAVGMGYGHNLLGYSNEGLSAAINVIDPDYLNVLGMRLLAGKDFRSVSQGDTIRPMIVNETMMKSLGFTVDNVLGQKIDFQWKKSTIIGVVRNFNFNSLKEGVTNQAFIASSLAGQPVVHVKIGSKNTAQTIDNINQVWKRLAPDVPLSYTFLDDEINSYYKVETSWIQIVGTAGLIALFLCCLGLLGLSSLTVINRTKEIGIRKVLGASLQSLLFTLSKNYIKALAVASVFAAAIATYAMNRWLQLYSYHVNVDFIDMILIVIASIVVALMCVCIYAVKAVKINPALSLTSE